LLWYFLLNRNASLQVQVAGLPVPVCPYTGPTADSFPVVVMSESRTADSELVCGQTMRFAVAES